MKKQVCIIRGVDTNEKAGGFRGMPLIITDYHVLDKVSPIDAVV